MLIEPLAGNAINVTLESGLTFKLRDRGKSLYVGPVDDDKLVVVKTLDIGQEVVVIKEASVYLYQEAIDEAR